MSLCVGDPASRIYIWIMPINYLELPIGAKYPYEVDCVVEIPKDTNVKYEYDEVHHVFRLYRWFIVLRLWRRGRWSLAAPWVSWI